MVPNNAGRSLASGPFAREINSNIAPRSQRTPLWFLTRTVPHRCAGNIC